MSRKYLEEIIPKEEIFGYHDETDERHERWLKQEEEYGFNDIETWDLDSAFAQIIYERLMMYLEYADKVVDLSFHTLEILGAKLTLKDAIEFTIWECKKAIKATDPDVYTKAMEIVWQMMSKMHRYLGW